MPAILRKELADYFNSTRVLVLMLITVAISAGALYAASGSIERSPGTFGFMQLFTSSFIINIPDEINSYLIYPNMLTHIFIPILGILLGFNLVVKERSSHTLRRLLYQPVFRDNIISAKFLAGLFIIILVVVTSLLLILGFGIRMTGVPPTSSDLMRLLLFGVSTIVYGAFWMGLAMIFSTIFRRSSLALAIPVAIQVILGTYIFLLPRYLTTQSTALALMRISPTQWFNELSQVLLLPNWRGMGLITTPQNNLSYMLNNPLSVGQSLSVISPQLVGLLAIAIAVLAIVYVIFLKKTARPSA